MRFNFENNNILYSSDGRGVSIKYISDHCTENHEMFFKNETPTFFNDKHLKNWILEINDMQSQMHNIIDSFKPIFEAGGKSYNIGNCDIRVIYLLINNGFNVDMNDPSNFKITIDNTNNNEIILFDCFYIEYIDGYDVCGYNNSYIGIDQKNKNIGIDFKSIYPHIKGTQTKSLEFYGDIKYTKKLIIENYFLEEKPLYNGAYVIDMDLSILLNKYLYEPFDDFNKDIAKRTVTRIINSVTDNQYNKLIMLGAPPLDKLKKWVFAG